MKGEGGVRSESDGEDEEGYRAKMGSEGGPIGRLSSCPSLPLRVGVDDGDLDGNDKRYTSWADEVEEMDSAEDDPIILDGVLEK